MTGQGNWGRWGPDDERGTLNLLSPERVLRACALARRGRIIPLGLPVDSRTARLPGRPPVQHYMAIDGADYEAGSRTLNGRAVADDMLVLSPHGTTSHVDALAHVWADQQLYNGHPQSTIRSRGARRCGIERVEGIVTRGILLDLPKLVGVEQLAPDVKIDAAMLAAAERQAGVACGPADAVLFRTGVAPSPGDETANQAGLDGSACRWLAERDPCLVGSDNAAVGPLVGGGGFHVERDDDAHLVLLWRHGILLAEMLELSALAASGATEFLFVLAPLRITGATASPANPIAVL